MPALIETETSRPKRQTPIQKFYSGANVFVTGGTGLLGQLLVEKLLRSCPDVGTIYMLIRPKKEKNILDRLDEILDGQLFDKVKAAYPKYKYKIVPVEGDCCLPGLGIKEQDRRILTSEVSVIFHVAATVNFDEKMKTAVDINVRGTKDVLDFCRQMSQLKAVVHVSTAYSNCAEDVIEESFYPTPIGYKKLLALAEILDEDTLNKVAPSLLGDLPNTYAFTKAVAENMVQDEGKGLPVGIYRPSIVISTYKEPIEGWINNLYGAVGVSIGAGTGIIRALHCDATANANIIPADMCVNGMIAVAWEINERRQNKIEIEGGCTIPIYNYESSGDCPITWHKYMDLTARYGLRYPTSHAIWYYSLMLIKNKRLYQLATIFLHFVPAFAIDAILTVLGKKRRFVKIYDKIHRFSEVISYFSTKDFKFRSNNVRRLISNMAAEDRDIFCCDLKRLDWHEYFTTHFKGIRVYLLNDPMDTLPDAVKKWQRLYWCHLAVKIIFFYATLKMSWTLISYVLRLAVPRY